MEGVWAILSGCGTIIVKSDFVYYFMFHLFVYFLAFMNQRDLVVVGASL